MTSFFFLSKFFLFPLSIARAFPLAQAFAPSRFFLSIHRTVAEEGLGHWISTPLLCLITSGALSSMVILKNPDLFWVAKTSEWGQNFDLHPFYKQAVQPFPSSLQRMAPPKKKASFVSQEFHPPLSLSFSDQDGLEKSLLHLLGGETSWNQMGSLGGGLNFLGKAHSPTPNPHFSGSTEARCAQKENQVIESPEEESQEGFLLKNSSSHRKAQKMTKLFSHKQDPSRKAGFPFIAALIPLEEGFFVTFFQSPSLPGNFIAGGASEQAQEVLISLNLKNVYRLSEGQKEEIRLWRQGIVAVPSGLNPGLKLFFSALDPMGNNMWPQSWEGSIWALIKALQTHFEGVPLHRLVVDEEWNTPEFAPARQAFLKAYDDSHPNPLTPLSAREQQRAIEEYGEFAKAVGRGPDWSVRNEFPGALYFSDREALAFYALPMAGNIVSGYDVDRRLNRLASQGNIELEQALNQEIEQNLLNNDADPENETDPDPMTTINRKLNENKENSLWEESANLEDETDADPFTKTPQHKRKNPLCWDYREPESSFLELLATLKSLRKVKDLVLGNKHPKDVFSFENPFWLRAYGWDKIGEGFNHPNVIRVRGSRSLSPQDEGSFLGVS